jgi:hypothetical protein
MKTLRFCHVDRRKDEMRQAATAVARIPALAQLLISRRQNRPRVATDGVRFRDAAAWEKPGATGFAVYG